MSLHLNTKHQTMMLKLFSQFLLSFHKMNATFFIFYAMKWHSYSKCCLSVLIIFGATVKLLVDSTFTCNIIKICSSIYTFTYTVYTHQPRGTFMLMKTYALQTFGITRNVTSDIRWMNVQSFCYKRLMDKFLPQ